MREKFSIIKSDSNDSLVGSNIKSNYDLESGDNISDDDKKAILTAMGGLACRTFSRLPNKPAKPTNDTPQLISQSGQDIQTVVDDSKASKTSIAIFNEWVESHIEKDKQYDITDVLPIGRRLFLLRPIHLMMRSSKKTPHVIDGSRISTADHKIMNDFIQENFIKKNKQAIVGFAGDYNKIAETAVAFKDTLQHNQANAAKDRLACLDSLNDFEKMDPYEINKDIVRLPYKLRVNPKEDYDIVLFTHLPHITKYGYEFSDKVGYGNPFNDFGGLMIEHTDNGIESTVMNGNGKSWGFKV